MLKSIGKAVGRNYLILFPYSAVGRRQSQSPFPNRRFHFPLDWNRTQKVAVLEVTTRQIGKETKVILMNR